MKIIKTYPEELTNKKLYDLTLSPKIQKMSENEGAVLEVAAYCFYEDEDSDGKSRPLLSVLTPDGESFATNSATFKEDFQRMIDMFGPAGVTAIEIISGTSKAGRKFITCAYAGE